MANFYHYLEWRGELSFEAAPFNEVDALILSWLSYADLKECVPNTPDETGITIESACEAFFNTHERLEKVNLLDSLNPPLTATVLLNRLATCERFKDLRLTYLIDRIDYENPQQFAAVTYFLPNNTLFTAFRGTDRTFVGWQEDFYMSCTDEIPSQRDALVYLEAVGSAFPNHRLIIGGHSKGGNLAAYAAVKASPSIKERILACYNNDGPGFSRGFAQSEAYQSMRKRIFKFVPQGSIVGMLFDYERDFHVIKSAQAGFLQHNGPCWEVMGDHFVRAQSISKTAMMFDESLQAWLNALDNAQRRSFIDALFSLFEKSALKTFDDIGNNKIRSILSIAHALSETAPEIRGMMAKTFFGLFKARSAFISSGVPVGDE